MNNYNAFNRILSIPAKKFLVRGSKEPIYLYDEDDNAYDWEFLQKVGATLIDIPSFQNGDKVITVDGIKGIFIGKSPEIEKAIIRFPDPHGTMMMGVRLEEVYWSDISKEEESGE